MVPQDIPADILAFLSQRIGSVPQLETLLMMSERAESVWTIEDVASRTYVSMATARSVLDALHRHRLIAIDEPAHGYRFGPHESADAALVARVAAYYRANVVAVATVIHEQASASIQEFARAFEFKKEP